ncbi:MAG: hypothetical protein Sv326_1349 (plasmid) [Candidatus Fermentimicrarchaeum limneticum]|uniref:Uncharacterized protein n=1 Tax=Fermentimicrarchaeum limneticum TaxID=2795018 RepID=A0A7D6BVP0_FERL1|nr:MAG: hypothetical protein Sv326_1349 [Candidatus Fermentimicrarchaeum limneticum]
MEKECTKGIHHVKNDRYWRREREKALLESPIDEKYLEKAGMMLEDTNYERKVADLMAIMAGKRLVVQTPRDIIDRG